MSEQMQKAFEAAFERDWEDPSQASTRHVFTLGFEAALATQPQAPQGLDEEDVDGHLKVALWDFVEKDAYQVVIPHGGILRGSRTGWITHIHVGNTFREAVQASIAAAPETPEGAKP